MQLALGDQMVIVRAQGWVPDDRGGSSAVQHRLSLAHCPAVRPCGATAPSPATRTTTRRAQSSYRFGSKGECRCRVKACISLRPKVCSMSARAVQCRLNRLAGRRAPACMSLLRKVCNMPARSVQCTVTTLAGKPTARLCLPPDEPGFCTERRWKWESSGQPQSHRSFCPPVLRTSPCRSQHCRQRTPCRDPSPSRPLRLTSERESFGQVFWSREPLYRAKLARAYQSPGLTTSGRVAVLGSMRNCWLISQTHR